MSTFNERENAFETGFSEEQKKSFKIEARASKLVGHWAADKMKLTGEDKENYAKEVIAANLDEPGYDYVRRKISDDLARHKIAFDGKELDAAIAKAVREATQQVQDGI